MALAINTNIASLSSQNSMNKAQESKETAMERLTTGKRINSAADDAAGLAIANKMTSQIKGLNQAVRNSNDGISMLQTAAGGLEESKNILQRMRELSVQSASGTYQGDNRDAMQDEVDALKDELDRISETTTFNGINVLDGSQQDTKIQAGANANETIGFSIGSTAADQLGSALGTNDVIGTQGTGLAAIKAAAASNANTMVINGAVVDSTALENAENMNEALEELSIAGVKATSFVETTGTTLGTGVTTSATAVTFSLTNNDGTATSFSVSDTSNMDEFVAAVNDNGKGVVKAELDADGKLLLSSDNVADMTISSAGSMTNQLGIAGPSTTVQASIGLQMTDKADTDGISVGYGVEAATAVVANKAIAPTEFMVNGVDVGTVAADADQDIQGANLVAAVNGVSDQTGVTASYDTASKKMTYISEGAMEFTYGGAITTAEVGFAVDALASENALAIALGVDARGDNAVVTGSANTVQAALAKGDITVNGVELDAVAAGADATKQAEGIRDAINEKTTETGVTATVVNDALQLTNSDGKEIEIDFTGAANRANTGLRETNVTETQNKTVARIDISTAEGAQDAIGVLDDALSQLSSIEGELGAVENRLSFTVSNLSNVSENASAARSRIEDTDYAAESANLSRAQVLQQAGQAMLSQANSAPQQVLSLLQ